MKFGTIEKNKNVKNMEIYNMKLKWVENEVTKNLLETHCCSIFEANQNIYCMIDCIQCDSRHVRKCIGANSWVSNVAFVKLRVCILDFFLNKCN